MNEHAALQVIQGENVITRIHNALLFAQVKWENAGLKDAGYFVEVAVDGEVGLFVSKWYLATLLRTVLIACQIQLVALSPLAGLAALRIFVHISLVALVAADTTLVLAKGLYHFLVNKDLKRWRPVLLRRVRYLVTLQPLPEVWLPHLLKVALVLEHVLDVP